MYIILFVNMYIHVYIYCSSSSKTGTTYMYYHDIHSDNMPYMQCRDKNNEVSITIYVHVHVVFKPL